METIEFGFTGEVHQAQCPCHSGKFLIVVWAIHPEHGRSPFPVGTSQHFDTQEQANKGMEAETMVVAKAFLKSIGLSTDDAAKVTVAHGEDAIKNEQRMIRESNPNLH